MKMFSDCWNCWTCACGDRNGCIAGHGDDYYFPAKKEVIISRLNRNIYPTHRDEMINFLKEKYNYDYVQNEKIEKLIAEIKKRLLDGKQKFEDKHHDFDDFCFENGGFSFHDSEFVRAWLGGLNQAINIIEDIQREQGE